MKQQSILLPVWFQWQFWDGLRNRKNIFITMLPKIILQRTSTLSCSQYTPIISTNVLSAGGKTSWCIFFEMFQHMQEGLDS